MSTIKRAALVTVLNGQTVSNAIDLGELAVVGLQTPAAFTGVAITFQASHDNTTFAAVTKVNGDPYALTVAASKYVIIPPIDLCGARFIKVVSGSAEAADRDIVLLLRAV